MKQLTTLITLFLLVIGTSVSWAQSEEPFVPELIATWNWQYRVPSTIFAETDLENSTGFVHCEVDPASLKLEVDATGGSFKVVQSGLDDDDNPTYYANLTSGCTIKVPVRRAEDIVTVTCQNAQYCNYKIGNLTVNSQTKSYSASATDAARGYALITAIGDVQFLKIEVKQKKFSSYLPMIQLNCSGWASFTSLLKGYVLTLPSTASAFVAIAVAPDDGDYGSVLLKKVVKFGYGEGVFINGANFDELYATITTGTSDVPNIENNLTVGCIEDVKLTYESNAYVIATKGADEQAGFYYVNNDVTVPMGHAYLHDPHAGARGAKALKITFADGSEATGIESLFAGAETETPAVFYNLSGQKVGKNYKGVVIGIDGKKYVK